MNTNRKYRELGLQKAAMLILNEIFMDDSSIGWAGSYQELEDMKHFLAPFNIYYADDFTGTWMLRDHENTRHENLPKSNVVFTEDEEDDLDREILGLKEIVPANSDFEKGDES